MSGYDTEPGIAPELAPETPHETDGRTGSGFHPVSVGHLVMGLAFVGLALVWLVIDQGGVEVEENGWILGLPWLAAGAVGLAVSALAQRRRP